MTVALEPIGYVLTEEERPPRHWSVSDAKGTLMIDEQYLEGLTDIKAGQRIVVLFHFHRSPPFGPEFLHQHPAHKGRPMGVFSICSPLRPNPIGMSILKVTGVKDNLIHVRHLDMIDGTPILDIKPHVEDRHSCPSYGGE